MNINNHNIERIEKSDIDEELMKISKSYLIELANYMKKKRDLDVLNTMGLSIQISINFFKKALMIMTTKEESKSINENAFIELLENFISIKKNLINKTNGENNELSL